MLRWQIRILRVSYILLDFVALPFSILLALKLAATTGWIERVFRSPLETQGFIGVTFLAFLLVFILFDLYESYINNISLIDFRLTIKTFLAFVLGSFLAFLFLYSLLPGYSYVFHLIFTCLYFLFASLIRFIYFYMRKVINKSNVKKNNVLIVGYSHLGNRYIDTIKKYSCLHYNIAGYVRVKTSPGNLPTTGSRIGNSHASMAIRQGNFNGSAVSASYDPADIFFEDTSNYSNYEKLACLGTLDNLVSIVNDHIIDELVVVHPLSYDPRLSRILSSIQVRGITITMLLNRENYDQANAIVTMIDDIPALKFHTVSLHEGQLLAKRVLDLCGAAVGLFVFALAWLVLAPLIRLESSGPVIFKQDRVGKNGRIFKMWKFRSMVCDAEEQKESLRDKNEIKGLMFKIADDPRVTRVGRFIRKTSLDELPQFYNVFVGDMSLVGTRPPTLDEVREYDTHHYRRIAVIPGITGLWQISGRSEIKDFEQVVKLDYEYINNWSVRKDLGILVKTIMMVLKSFVPSSPGLRKIEDASFSKRDDEQVSIT